MRTAAVPWICSSLASQGVVQQGGKWQADFHGTAVGSFATQAEALKAYRKAVEDKFGDMAALPTDSDIDAALADGDINVAPRAPVEPPQPRTPPAKPKLPAQQKR